MVELVLLWAGVVVVAVAALGAVLSPNTYAALHLLGPVTSLAAPLIGGGVLLRLGWGISGGLVLLIVALLAGTGPSLSSAIGQVAAAQEGRTTAEPAE